MFKMKEISANQVLTLLFMSLGSEASVGFKEIDRFFDILIKVSNKDTKNNEYILGINMPMNSNFDEMLFNEITEVNYKYKIVLVKSSSLKNAEIIKEKLTKHFISLVGDNKEFMNDCKIAMKIFSEEYNKNKIQEENIQKITKVTFLEKVKGLVKYK